MKQKYRLLTSLFVIICLNLISGCIDSSSTSSSKTQTRITVEDKKNIKTEPPESTVKKQTVSTFEGLVPELGECKIIKDTCVFFCPSATTQNRGFICNFINTLSSDVTIKNIDVLINERHCFMMRASLLSYLDNDKSAYIFRSCNADNTCEDESRCIDYRGVKGSIRCDDIGGNGEYILVPSNSDFYVSASTNIKSKEIGSIGPCADIKKDSPYEVKVDITYYVPQENGEIEKHSSGKIDLISS